MNSEQWRKVKGLFDAALELAPAKRERFLDNACGTDDSLRREVEKLLASFKDDSFMEQPAATELASLIVERNSKLTDGEQIAHYRILSQIGAGGMGEVYLAKDTRLHRKIALKILPAALSGDQDRLRRFEQEACAASALNHPNILTIYEIGETAKTRYIATEFIDGETLRDKLERDEIRLKEILDVAEQTAFALSAAHAAGIVHRDIKPENIMLRADGIVKVLDFGLAKLTEKKEIDSDAEAETFAQVNTQAGMILGTVAYMSPEQARGKETNARTDIWSLGVVLYEMLAGKVPFAGETTSDTIAAILKSEPAPTGENTPPELNRIVRKTLQKNADERYQTVKDLLLDLKNLKRELEFSEELERSNIPSFAKSANIGTNQSSENATAI
ncbi:MAG: serine/threonine protein kinase, partial [Acidobacteriota bacterium]|nr:serine/threonine protein kinase [Acidobacteriota bacterium]